MRLRRTGSGPGDPAADRVRESSQLIDRGIALGKQGDYAGARDVLTTAADALAASWRQGSAEPVDLQVNRELARAWWRLSMVQGVLGQRAEAWSTGVRGVSAGQTLLTVLPAGAAERDEITAEVAVAATDLAEVAFAGGSVEDGLRLLDLATSLCLGNEDRAVQRALGTAVHNRANAMIGIIRDAPDPTRMGTTLRDLSRFAEDAVTLRRRLRDPLDPLSWYELADSLLLLSIATAMTGDLPRSATLLTELTAEARPLASGPAVDRLRRLAAGQADMVAHLAPAEAARHRQTGNWPI